MGIDILDIAVRIEKEFDIRIDAQDFEAIAHDHDVRVGELYLLTLKKMHVRDSARADVHLNYELWMAVRQALHVATGAALDDLKLHTPLVELLPRESRRVQWEKFRQALTYRTPELEYPVAVPIGGLLVALAVVGVEQFGLWQNPVARALWPVLGAFGVWMMAEAYFKIMRLLAPLRTRLPARSKTVKELCRAIRELNYNGAADFAVLDQIEADSLLADARCVEAWERLQKIIASVAGCKTVDVGFQSRLFADLGMS